MDFLQRMQSERQLIVDLLLHEHELRYHTDYIETQDRIISPFSVENIARDKACSFTGHRPEKLKRSYKEYICSLTNVIMDSYDEGFRIFISGMSRGIDLWAAHIILVLRSFHPEIRLVAAIPFDGFESRWDLEDRCIFQSILAQSDAACVVTEVRAARSFQLRNVWMVDHSSRLIACWDGEAGGTANTIKYAQRMKKQILLI